MTGSAALAQAALGDWRRSGFRARRCGQPERAYRRPPFPAVQAAIDAVAAKTAAELGPVGNSPREAGSGSRPGDCIATALGLAPESRPPPRAAGTPAHQARTGSHRADRRGPDEPADRRTAVHRPAHRRHARGPHPGQARLLQPLSGRGDHRRRRPHAWPRVARPAPPKYVPRIRLFPDPAAARPRVRSPRDAFPRENSQQHACAYVR